MEKNFSEAQAQGPTSIQRSREGEEPGCEILSINTQQASELCLFQGLFLGVTITKNVSTHLLIALGQVTYLD